MNIKYSKAKSNWEHIAMAINDKRLGLNHYAPITPENVYSGGIEIYSVATTSSDSSSNSTVKQLKLLPEDKEKVKHLFSNLNESNMWRLLIGTFVEKKMEEFAFACKYEHPVHSMILDLRDGNWKKCLTDKKINEIKNYKRKQLVELPRSVDDCIESLQEFSNALLLQKQLPQELKYSASEWIRNTLLEYLYKSF